MTQWSEARRKGFIVSVLRSGTRRWPAKYETLNEAYVGIRHNPKTKRDGKHYLCASCQGEFPTKQVQIDHIIPIVDPKTGFTTWDDFINGLFCSKENLQVLCVPCHAEKTALERSEKPPATERAEKPTTEKKKRVRKTK